MPQPTAPLVGCRSLAATACSLFLLTATAPLPAQIVGGAWEVLETIDGDQQQGNLGFSLGNAGDLDGDGIDDYVAGAPLADTSGGADAGQAIAYSGATGEILFVVDGPDVGDQCGYAVCGAGDVNQDGYGDFIVGLPYADPTGADDAGSVFVLSGLDGGLIWRIQGDEGGMVMGWSVAGGEDVNGDGFDDFVIGAPYASPNGQFRAGSAFVMSGIDGSVLARIDGPNNGYWAGHDVAFTPDVTGDGRAEVLVGAPRAAPNGIYEAGSIYVVDASTGVTVRTLQGVDEGGQIGYALDGIGDLDGDGIGDSITGAYLNEANGYTASGSVIAFSGADGTVIWHWMGAATWDRLGWNVAGLDDVDGDLVPDVLASAPFADPDGIRDAGEAYLYSGRTGELLGTWAGTEVEDRLGYGLASAGDPDFDGRGDFLISTYWGDPNGVANAGGFEVHGLDGWLSTDGDEISSSLGGVVTLHLDFPESEAGALYAVLASPNGTGPTLVKDILVPLSAGTLFENMLGGFRPPPLEDETGNLDANGQGEARLVNFPGGLDKYIGWTIYAAALTGDGPGAPRLSSSAVAIRVVP